MSSGTKWTRQQWFLILMISMMHGLNHAFYVMITPLFVAMQQFYGFDGLLPAMAIGSSFLLVVLSECVISRSRGHYKLYPYEENLK